MLSSSLICVLSVCLCLFSACVGETIVSDNFGNAVTLPLTGGDDTGGFSISQSLADTTNYVLNIFINDANNGNGVEMESFYIINNFGGATLLPPQTFTPLSGPTVTGNLLGSSLIPNNKTGIFTYLFHIPSGNTLNAHITYINQANPVEVDQITISVDNPDLPSVITGDPQFIGLRGQSYQVHGLDGTIYNIITEKNLQVNSRFIFLSQGKCPVLNGVTHNNCWSHPGSYLGEIGIIHREPEGKQHTALIVGGSSKQGFNTVMVDGQKIRVGQNITADSFSLHYADSHHLLINALLFDFDFSNSDYFINQAIKIKTSLSKLECHGLLGQTHSSRIYPSTNTRYIEGNVDDYVIIDNNIFGTDFVFNQFHQ